MCARVCEYNCAFHKNMRISPRSTYIFSTYAPINYYLLDWNTLHHIYVHSVTFLINIIHSCVCFFLIQNDMIFLLLIFFFRREERIIHEQFCHLKNKTKSNSILIFLPYHNFKRIVLVLKILNS